MSKDREGDVVYFGSMSPVVCVELGVIIAEDFLFVVEDLDPVEERLKECE